MHITIPDRAPAVTPAGEGKGAWLAALEQGAHLLQSTTPLRGFDVYVVGFHCPKDEPHEQMEAHHYCKVVNDDLLQCVLFDGNTKEANLIGIEYIVSGRLFDTLPESEKDYWHPHNYEVFSGELVAPGLPDAAETAFMKQLVNSYGKTWHTWHTGRHDGAPGHDLPLGDPMLMWSFNREGECEESLKDDRNRLFGIDPEKKAEQRQAAYLDLARPQRGVDAMADQFTGTTPIPGVVDVDAAR
ncbi:DUF1264 domain-containing protein [Nocardioides panaciterrulae]|uniref:DUF1264 domain-containing protein n=1 Tax=Nocardioides panaciterrulae TaxID=661492 RepID=A0A7Y9E3V7_9ACTN|nr:hypothetical protein [Nocardioides panaciterrulae]